MNINLTNPKSIEEIKKSLIKLDSEKNFTISSSDNQIIIKSNLIKTETLNNGVTRYTYANNVFEEFTSVENENELGFLEEYYQGFRLYPCGKKEVGKFSKNTKKLISGYKIYKDKTEFINPRPIISIKDKSNEILEIIEYENKLIVLKKNFLSNHTIHYEQTVIPIIKMLLQEIELKDLSWDRHSIIFNDGISIKKVLDHDNFIEKQKLLEYVFSPDERGDIRIFKIKNNAALDLLTIGFECRMDFSKIRSSKLILSFFIRAANSETKLLDKLIELFPQTFLSIGEKVIEQLQEKYTHAAVIFTCKFKKAKGKLNDYLNIWLAIAQRKKLDEALKKQFDSLDINLQKKLYDAAFFYNNPFIYEPSDPPINPKAYSVNLMWINEKKMMEDQKFLMRRKIHYNFSKKHCIYLFGTTKIDDIEAKHFQDNFINPISDWAIKNCGSSINIWYDSNLATEKAIENLKKTLLDQLNGKPHGTIYFRDIRKIEIVQKNQKVFQESVSVYFRADLLRAIVGDYILRNKEVQFYVYADFDMQALFCNEIFDKRTVDSLKSYGFVMGKTRNGLSENGFQIINGNNKAFLNLHKKRIIDANIKRGMDKLEKNEKIRNQMVYECYFFFEDKPTKPVSLPPSNCFL